MQHPQNRGMPCCQPLGPTFIDLEASLWGPQEGAHVRLHGRHVNVKLQEPENGRVAVFLVDADKPLSAKVSSVSRTEQHNPARFHKETRGSHCTRKLALHLRLGH